MGIGKYPLVEIVGRVKGHLLLKYGTDLRGKCVEASELLVHNLVEAGYTAKVVEGYCWYDCNLEGCTNRPFDEHTWVEVLLSAADDSDTIIYVDITAEQFNHYLSRKLKDIIIGDRPKCMSTEKPTMSQMAELGWY